MKRPPISFAVEHKRRPRRLNAEPVSIWSDAAGRALRGLLRTAAERDVRAGRETAVIAEGPDQTDARRSVPAPRILDVQAPVDAIEEPVAPPQRRRGRPNRRPADARTEAMLVDTPVVARDHPDEAEQPADPAPVSPATIAKPTYRERRLAARKALPIGERWKWRLGSKGTGRKKR